MSPVISPRRADTGSPGAPRGGSFAGHPDDDPCGRSDTGAAPHKCQTFIRYPCIGIVTTGRKVSSRLTRSAGLYQFPGSFSANAAVKVAILISRHPSTTTCPISARRCLPPHSDSRGSGIRAPQIPEASPSPAHGSSPRRAAARAGPRAWPGRAGRRARRRSEPIRGRIPETVDYRGAPAYQSVWKLPARHSPADAKGAPR